MRHKYSEGTVALTTVLIISAILLIGGVTVILSGIDLTISTKNFETNRILQGVERTCLEESLNRVKSSSSFTGNITFTEAPTTCTASVSNDPLHVNFKVIAVTSSKGSYTINHTYTVDISQSPFEILK